MTARKHACPVCGAPTVPKVPKVPKDWPFCSRRCADVDLGRWLKGSYRIPTEERPADGPGPDSDAEDDNA